MHPAQPGSTLERPSRSPDRMGARSAAVTLAAAFGTYFCMYGFRKPFTAATYATVSPFGAAIDEKSLLVVAQVLGYMLSKFLGIRVVAETAPARRWARILVMIGVAELALILFGLAPPGRGFPLLFANGLALGMVFGMVLGYLEGRRQTEALAAGLCASFILADGVTKTVGGWLLGLGVGPYWMPAVAGLVFLGPLLLCLGVLSRTPPPGADDVAHRSERAPMTRADRRMLARRYGPGLAGILLTYLMVTILRSVRADFAPELWAGLRTTVSPSLFTRSELLVAAGVLTANGLCALIPGNRAAFFTSLGIAVAGIVLVGGALAARCAGGLDGFAFMVLVGLGLYLPYVAVHTTIFERLLALTRERGNIGFLMYVADAVGYLGYAVVVLLKQARAAVGAAPATGAGAGVLDLFTGLGWAAVALSLAGLLGSGAWFARHAAMSPTGGPIPHGDR